MPRLSLCLLLVMAPVVHASGLFRSEQSVMAWGSANAGATVIQGSPDLMGSNPAALSVQAPSVGLGLFAFEPDQTVSQVGPEVLGTSTSAQSGLSSDTVTSGYFSFPLNEQWAMGVGRSSPYGARLTYTSDFLGGFDAFLNTLEVQETAVAWTYQATPSVAVGLSLFQQTLEQERRSILPPSGSLQVEGESTENGYSLGFQMQVRESLRIGMSYRGSVTHKVGGAATVLGNAGELLPAGSYTSNTEILLPSRLSLGADWAVTPKFSVMADVSRHYWGELSAITLSTQVGDAVIPQVLPERYQDVTYVAVGVDYALNEAWAVRAGVASQPAAVVDGTQSFAFPDADKTVYSAGLSFQLSDNLGFDLAVSSVEADRLNLRRDLGVGTPIQAQVDSEYTVYGLAVRYQFDER